MLHPLRSSVNLLNGIVRASIHWSSRLHSCRRWQCWCSCVTRKLRALMVYSLPGSNLNRNAEQLAGAVCISMPECACADYQHSVAGPGGAGCHWYSREGGPPHSTCTYVDAKAVAHVLHNSEEQYRSGVDCVTKLPIPPLRGELLRWRTDPTATWSSLERPAARATGVTDNKR